VVFQLRSLVRVFKRAAFRRKTPDDTWLDLRRLDYRQGAEYQTRRFGEREVPQWRHSGVAKAGHQPIEVRMAGGFHSQNDEFRDLVGVQLVEADFESCQLLSVGLDEEQGFGGRLYLALPMIDGLDRGDQGCAGGQALFDQGATQTAGFAGAGASG